MLDTESKRRKEQQKQKVKKRYNVTIDPENYMFIPAKKQTDYYDNDVNQRVAIYVRVSTDDVRQTTSYELQKKYYEEFVTRHPNWTLVKIYADEGISGTSLKKRDEFNRMIADCRAGKIDMIITKSVSRFARNVEDFIGTVRNLAELKPRVGVFFESEAIFSLNDDSQMALTFQATMAEEESHMGEPAAVYQVAEVKERVNPETPLLEKGDEIIDMGADFDFDGFQVVRREFFAHLAEPAVTFNNCRFYVNSACLNKFPDTNFVQVLVNRNTKIMALRPCAENARDSFAWCSISKGKRKPKQTTCKLFFAKIVSLMEWNPDYRYKLLGRLIHANGQYMIAFDLNATETYQRTFQEGSKPKTSRTPVFPAGWQDQFGLPYKEHQQSMQINIFDGYAIYSIKDTSASEAADEVKQDTAEPQAPSQQYSPEVRP